MTLVDERPNELDNASLTEHERGLLRCRVAADLIQAGQYEAAREMLGGLWPGVGRRPSARGWPAAAEAELFLQCGTLTGWLGDAYDVSGAQEKAKDMLSEAGRMFRSQGMPSKVAETQYELGMCYWRLGACDEARLMMRDAMGALKDSDSELKAKIFIRRTTVELCENKFYEALDILKEAQPVFDSAGDALKGRWHGQMGLVLSRLADVEANDEYNDRAVIEFTAAVYHYERAGQERCCAASRNHAARLLNKLGRYDYAHEHLDRAGAALLRLGDEGLLAQVDATRARVYIAEGKYAEADRVVERAVRVLEKGASPADLSDALTARGLARARLGAGDESADILRRAISVAEEGGAYTNAGLAALTLIEEHGGRGALPQSELYNLYCRADEFLKDARGAEEVRRLRDCASVVMRRMADVRPESESFSFYGVVQDFESRIIAQALDEAGGSVTGAAKLLGLKHQTLISMLETRHKGLKLKRKPPGRRLRSLIK